jgi:hypothetical protein
LQLKDYLYETSDTTGGPQVTYSPVPGREIIFNLLLVTTSLFIFFASKDFQKVVWFLSRPLFYAKVNLELFRFSKC